MIVPNEETIKGNLIVKNGQAKIDGRVDGNVIMINSDKLIASAGHVTSEFEQFNQIMGRIWFKIKHAIYGLTSFAK